MSNVTPAFLYPVDYTSRDYLSLRTDLINVLKSRIPEWEPDDPSDILVALVESVAYVGDILNYYIDRAAAETFLGTASLRQSLLNISSLLGYTPAGRVASTVPITFTNTGQQNAFVPGGGRLSTVLRSGETNLPLTFEVAVNPQSADGSWSVPAGGSAVVIPAVEGQTYHKILLGQSSGLPGQVFELRETPLINRSLSISVGVSPENSTPYTYVQNLYEATPSDTMFTYRTDDRGVTSVTFGDGVSGVIPPLNQDIYATYRLGGGVVGNIAHGQSFVPADFSFTGTIRNQMQATGGAQEESNEQIRQAAFTAFRTRNSAVTKQDFQDLALNDNRVSKSKARGNSVGNMLVYIAPVSSGNQKTDPQPGYDAYNVVSRKIISNVVVLTLAETPQFQMSQVTISGMGAPWDGTFTGTAGPDNTVSYPRTAANRVPESCSGVLVTHELENFAAVREDVRATLQSKGMVGTIVKVLPPRYKDVKITVDIGILPQFRQSSAITAVKTAMAAYMSYNQMPFNFALRPQEVLSYLVSGVPEVAYADVKIYSAPDSSTSVPVVTAASDEIFRLLDYNLVVTVDEAAPGIVNS